MISNTTDALSERGKLMLDRLSALGGSLVPADDGAVRAPLMMKSAGGSDDTFGTRSGADKKESGGDDHFSGVDAWDA